METDVVRCMFLRKSMNRQKLLAYGFEKNGESFIRAHSKTAVFL